MAAEQIPLTPGATVRIEDGTHSEYDRQRGQIVSMGRVDSMVWVESIQEYVRVKNAHLRVVTS